MAMGVGILDILVQLSEVLLPIRVICMDVWPVVCAVIQGMPCLIFMLDTSDFVAVVQKRLINKMGSRKPRCNPTNRKREMEIRAQR